MNLMFNNVKVLKKIDFNDSEDIEKLEKMFASFHWPNYQGIQNLLIKVGVSLVLIVLFIKVNYILEFVDNIICFQPGMQFTFDLFKDMDFNQQIY